MLKLKTGMVISLVEIEGGVVPVHDIPFYYLILDCSASDFKVVDMSSADGLITIHNLEMLCLQSFQVIRENHVLVEKDCNSDISYLPDGYSWRFFC